MGQGYSAIHPSSGSASLDTPELADLEYDRTLSGPRFLKTIRARAKNGLAVVKVYTKPYAALSLKDRIDSLISERRKLADVPNALTYHRILESPTCGYLVRQHVNSSLYDRISTNPPLEDIERRWLAFQLLCALRDCHARNVIHGDIKTDNLLLTSWNWLYLTDFSASVKPPYLPEDNPVDFTLFYDTTARRVCYIAPERFLSSSQASSQTSQGLLQWTVDIFSAGCVIAELFTEKPTFTLSELFRYRKGDFDPSRTLLNDIPNPHIRELVTHMIQLTPDSRYSAQEYLDFWKGKAFPAYFYDFLHQYTHLITDPFTGHKAVVVSKTNTAESDDRIDRIYQDFDKISIALNFYQSTDTGDATSHDPLALDLQARSLLVDVSQGCHVVKQRGDSDADNGALLFSGIITASIRSAARARTRLRACELLLACVEQLTDEAKLDRILPFVMMLLDDDNVAVKIAALRAATHILSLVTVLSPINAFIFPRYVFPRLQRLVASPAFANSPPLRAIYASCLASLATTAATFLDLTQAFQSDISLPLTDLDAEDDAAAHAAYQVSHDAAREELTKQFEAQTKIFLTDDDADVRRAFLGSVPSLCVFFGDTLASDLILTHLNTYLNDENWILKCSLLSSIVGVAVFIGGTSVVDFILPLMLQAITDPEETVTEQALRSISSMTSLGLFPQAILIDLITTLAKFTLHPNQWIREAAAQFISVSVNILPQSVIRSLVQPVVATVLKIQSADMSEPNILDTLSKPLPRGVFEMAKVWATRDDASRFWQPVKNTRTLALERAEFPSASRHTRQPSKDQSIAGTKDDEQWLTRLRNAGMHSEDESKLLAMREYIKIVATRASKTAQADQTFTFDHVMSLTAAKIPLENVLFDDEVGYYNQMAQKPNEAKPTDMTLTDALNDALKTGRSPVSGLPAGQLEARIDQLVSRGHQQHNSSEQPAEPEPAADSEAKEQKQPDKQGVSSARTKENAFDLIRPGGQAKKATAATGTESVTASGRLNVPSSQMNTPLAGLSEQPSPVPLQTPKNFVNAQNISHDGFNDNAEGRIDFGPAVDPYVRTADQVGRWTPAGQLVATLGEHTAQITCLAIAPDQLFFITGAKDGTVRLWDTARLERNITHRSRQVHRHTSAASITSLCFVDRTHSFISAASDGSIDVVRVDTSTSSGTLRYNKLRVLQSWNISSGRDHPKTGKQSHAIQLQHARVGSQSVCLVLTSACTIIPYNLRNNETLYELLNPLEHGLPTSFCVHRRRQWLVVATTRGVLDLWDMRFRVLLRSWTLPGRLPIYNLSLHPGKRSTHRTRICLAGGTGMGDVSVWDLEKQICTDLFQTTVGSDDGTVSRGLKLESYDSQRTQSQQTNTESWKLGDATEISAGVSSASVRAFAMHMHTLPSDDASGTATSTESRQAFLITGGPDLHLRYWDTERVNNSSIIGGQTVSEQVSSLKRDASGRGVFSMSQHSGDTKIYMETSGQATGTSSKQVQASKNMSPKQAQEDTMSVLPIRGTSTTAESSTTATTRVNATASVTRALVDNIKSQSGKDARQTSSSANKTGSAGPKVSRYDIIRSSAAGLSKSHADQITCVALLERPFPMILSADRSGMIYVYR